MQYKVLSAVHAGDYETQWGKNDKYSCVLVGDDKKPVSAEVSQKQGLPAPKEGDVLNGIIEQTQYGIRFKKDRAGGNFGGGNPRAAALQAAATFCVGKAQIMAMADPEKALEYLTGKHTTEVAMGFLTFLNGNQNAANSPQNAAGSTTNGQFDNIDDLMPNGDSKAKEEEINLEDIPF